MDDAAAAGEEDAGVAEGAESCAEGEDLFGRGGVGEGDLDDGDLGVGEGEEEGDPGAVIEAALEFEGDVEAVLAEALGGLFGEVGVAGGGVADAGELRGEAGEVVEEGGRQPGGNADGARGFPVGGEDEDAAGGGAAVAELREGLGVFAAVECGERGAVTEEDGGSAFHVSCLQWPYASNTRMPAMAP